MTGLVPVMAAKCKRIRRRRQDAEKASDWPEAAPRGWPGLGRSEQRLFTMRPANDVKAQFETAQHALIPALVGGSKEAAIGM